MPPKTRSQAADSEAQTLSASARQANHADIRQRPREGSRSRNIDDVYDAK